jgi:hypothetical protein
MGLLTAYLLGLWTAISSKKKAGSENHQAADGSYCHTEINRPLAVVCIPPAPTEQEYAEQKANKRRKNIKFWTQIIIAVATVCYLCATILIWCANKKAAKATQDTFVEIQKQTKLMRQQLIATDGAVLQVEVHEADTPVEGLIGGLRNSGVSPATNVYLRIEATQQHLIDGRIENLGTPLTFEHGPIRVKGSNGTWPDVMYPHEWPIPWIHGRDPSPKSFVDSWPDNWPETMAEIKAHLAYDNGFGDRIEQDFCL